MHEDDYIVEDDTAEQTSSGRLDKIVMPFGMKTVPLGWPLMADAFISFVSFALDAEKIKKQYLEQELIDLDQFKGQSVLEQMIDAKTGYAESVLAKFMDWLVINHWGAEA